MTPPPEGNSRESTNYRCCPAERAIYDSLNTPYREIATPRAGDITPQAKLILESISRRADFYPHQLHTFIHSIQELGLGGVFSTHLERVFLDNEPERASAYLSVFAAPHLESPHEARESPPFEWRLEHEVFTLLFTGRAPPPHGAEVPVGIGLVLIASQTDRKAAAYLARLLSWRLLEDELHNIGELPTVKAIVSAGPITSASVREAGIALRRALVMPSPGALNLPLHGDAEKTFEDLGAVTRERARSRKLYEFYLKADTGRTSLESLDTQTLRELVHLPLCSVQNWYQFLLLAPPTLTGGDISALSAMIMTTGSSMPQFKRLLNPSQDSDGRYLQPALRLLGEGAMLLLVCKHASTGRGTFTPDSFRESFSEALRLQATLLSGHLHGPPRQFRGALGFKKLVEVCLERVSVTSWRESFIAAAHGQPEQRREPTAALAARLNHLFPGGEPSRENTLRLALQRAAKGRDIEFNLFLGAILESPLDETLGTLADSFGARESGDSLAGALQFHEIIEALPALYDIFSSSGVRDQGRYLRALAPAVRFLFDVRLIRSTKAWQDENPELAALPSLKLVELFHAASKTMSTFGPTFKPAFLFTMAYLPPAAQAHLIDETKRLRPRCASPQGQAELYEKLRSRDTSWIGQEVIRDIFLSSWSFEELEFPPWATPVHFADVVSGEHSIVSGQVTRVKALMPTTLLPQRLERNNDTIADEIAISQVLRHAPFGGASTPQPPEPGEIRLEPDELAAKTGGAKVYQLPRTALRSVAPIQGAKVVELIEYVEQLQLETHRPRIEDSPQATTELKEQLLHLVSNRLEQCHETIASDAELERQITRMRQVHDLLKAEGEKTVPHALNLIIGALSGEDRRALALWCLEQVRGDETPYRPLEKCRAASLPRRIQDVAAAVRRVEGYFESLGCGSSAVSLVDHLFRATRIREIEQQYCAVAPSKVAPMELRLYATRGYEMQMMGFLSNTCAVRLRDPRVDRGNMFFVPFHWQEAPLHEPVFLGGFGVIMVDVADAGGKRAFILRGVNPTRLLLERAATTDIVSMVVAEAHRMRRAAGFDYVLLPGCANNDYYTLTNHDDIWRIFRERYYRAGELLTIGQPGAAKFNHEDIKTPCVILPDNCRPPSPR